MAEGLPRRHPGGREPDPQLPDLPAPAVRDDSSRDEMKIVRPYVGILPEMSGGPVGDEDLDRPALDLASLDAFPPGEGGGRSGRPAGADAAGALAGPLLRRWRGIPRVLRVLLAASLVLTLFAGGVLAGREWTARQKQAERLVPVVPPTPAPVTATVTVSPSATAGPSSGKKGGKGKGGKKRPPGKAAPTPRVTVTRRVTPPPPRAAPPSCVIDYDVTDQDGDRFEADVDIKVFGTEINGWRMEWRFPDERAIVDIQDARFGQDGTSVAVVNGSDNGVISEDDPVDFGFDGVGGVPDAEPVDVTLNGAPCAVD